MRPVGAVADFDLGVHPRGKGGTPDDDARSLHHSGLDPHFL